MDMGPGGVAEAFVDENTISLARSLLGLSRYEASAYLILAAAGPLGVPELARMAGIPRTKCYSVVRSLISKGLAVRSASRPLKVQAVDPAAALSKAAEEACSRARGEAAAVERALEGLRRSLAAGRSSEPAAVIVIESLEALAAQLAGDIKEAREEILIAVSRSPIAFPWEALIPSVVEALSRGVSIEYAAPPGSQAAARLQGSSGQLGLPGSLRLRECPWIEMPFVVIDGEVVYNIFTDPVRRAHLFTMRIQNQRYGRSMRIYFLLLTGSGCPPGSGRAIGAPESGRRGGD